MKHSFPFRLGATSYVIPADILTNVRTIAPAVDDIELVLFESADISPLPDAKTIEALADLAGKRGITYTVHLPLDISLGDPDPAIRQSSIRKCRQTIDATSRLEPFAYILHCTGNGQRAPDDQWLRSTSASIDALLAAGAEPDRLCMENLDYPFSFVEQVAESKGLSVCCDLGHLRLNEQAMLQNPGRLLRRCRVIHLHGIADGKDHQAVSALDCREYSAILSRLLDDKAERVVTFEVFDRNRLEKSMLTVKEFTSCRT